MTPHTWMLEGSLSLADRWLVHALSLMARDFTNETPEWRGTREALYLEWPNASVNVLLFLA